MGNCYIIGSVRNFGANNFKSETFMNLIAKNYSRFHRFKCGEWDQGPGAERDNANRPLSRGKSPAPCQTQNGDDPEMKLIKKQSNS